MKGQGTLLVIEGLDGSGKATQAAKLVEWLKSRGKMVEPVTFPDYHSDSSAAVRMYLKGEIGGVSDVNAYAASTFYAVDRYISYQNKWKNAYMAGHTIVADRYTTSNAAHQMSKLYPEEWKDYLSWLEDLEYSRMGLPAPDMVLYLDMDPVISKRLLAERYGDNAHRDIHESDTAYLASCRKAALFAAGVLGWKVIRCDDGTNPYSVEEIFDRIKIILA